MLPKSKTFLLGFTTFVLFILSSSTVLAQENWIKSFEFVGANKPIGDVIFVDTEYVLEISISVPISIPDKRFYIKIADEAQPVTPTTPFWEISTSGYPGIDNRTRKELTNRKITFRVVKGDLVIRVKFKIPAENNVIFTVLTPTNKVLKIYTVKSDFRLVTVVLEDNVVGQIKYKLFPSKIYEFEKKVAEIKSSAPEAYEDLISSLLAIADEFNSLGLTELATRIVDVLQDYEFPEPPNPLIMYSMIGVAGVLAATTVVFLLLYLRAKGRASYITETVNSALRDIASLQASLERVDKRLSRDLSSISEKLRRSIR